MEDEEETQPLGEEDEEEEIIALTPFRTLLHRAISFLRREEEKIEQEMLDTAIEHSLDSYRESLFSADPDQERKVNLDPFVLEKDLEEECHLCLEPMKKGNLVITLPCRHLFHSPCVDDLVIHQHIVCPLCRKSIPLEASEKKSSC
jgi:hypothetical protein